MKKVISFLFFWILLQNISAQVKLTDQRDGNVYKTITVNNVTWMAENLRFNTPEGALSFDNDPDNKSAYGLLYGWEIATKVCPDGWRLPTGEEFHLLMNYFDQKQAWKGSPGDTASFRIQLAGMKDYEGTFTEMDESAYYWTSTEYDKDNAEYFSYLVVVDTAVADISRKDDIPDIHGAEKANKYSVRCVKK